MDDSDQDFVDLCSKLLKRVRRNPGDIKPPRKAKNQLSGQTSGGGKRCEKNRKCDSGLNVIGTQCVDSGTIQRTVSPTANGETACDRDGESSVLAVARPAADRGLTAKDKVLLRMQEFRKQRPPKMKHNSEHQSQRREGCSSQVTDSDEALALKLQQELDREAADLGDGGLFICQICHRDVSHMTPEGRTQHLNRCLDGCENNTQASRPPPGVLDCPVCGKKFKSQKSRSTHLKRCSSDMGVSPAVLLQALQRQAQEVQDVPVVNTDTQSKGTKRKGSSKPGLQVKKKPKKTTDPLDEDTMVALALSSSLLEQETKTHGEAETETAASRASMTSGLKWRPDADKGRSRKRKGVSPRPPPLLLVADAEAALLRLQERVSAILLRSRSPSPPTPTRCPTGLSGLSSVASLWQKSALQICTSICDSNFYTPELSEFITPWKTEEIKADSSSVSSDPSLPPASESVKATLTDTTQSMQPSTSQTAACSSTPSTPGTGQLPVGSQALRDLMELAEDGMTLTQCGYTSSGFNKDKSSIDKQSEILHLSGFVPEEAEEQAQLCVSGFLRETADRRSEDDHSPARRKSVQLQRDEEKGSHRSAAVSRLTSDLSCMVNNPQLSDVQLQVDCGEVFFAHSFMIYARCPLLAEMVHESGFLVREEGGPAAHRVLMNDVPGQAVFTLLQYLYTAKCSFPASLQPHMLELASRFDLLDLQQLCERQREEALFPGGEDDYTHPEENGHEHADQAFEELLRSMWNEEDEGDEDVVSDKGKEEERWMIEDHQSDDVTSAEAEICEEQVNEEELEEIYEFAATQRKREEEEEEEEEEEKDKVSDKVFTKQTEPNTNNSLDLSYNRLFSETFGLCEKDDSLSPTSAPLKTKTPKETILQSSPSIVDNVSLSPSPSTSKLPVPGVSPYQVTDCSGERNNEIGAEVSERRYSPKQEIISRGDSYMFHSPTKQKSPEVIVLSDSDEEMEEEVTVPTSCVFVSVTKQPSCIQVDPQSSPKPSEPTPRKTVSTSAEVCSSNVDGDHGGAEREPSLVDCSLEVSWLIPSTPLQHERSTKTDSSRSSSTQTNSSMCRTQLFPRGDRSSVSSPFSSPAFPSNCLHSSSRETRLSAHTGQSASSISRLKQAEIVSRSSASDSNITLQKACSDNNRGVSQHQRKFSLLCQPSPTILNQDTAQQAQKQPYSSTPLHTEVQHLPVLLAASPLTINVQKLSPSRQEKYGETSETTEIGSFHLSPLSNPSDPLTPSSHEGLHAPRDQNRSSSESCSVEDREFNQSGGNEKEKSETECENKDTENESNKETGAPEDEECSFRQSFMDEPPIAFNDSWGLGACTEANPGCFSLRLEDSEGSSHQEHSTAQCAQPDTSRRAHRSPSCGSSPLDLNSSLMDPKAWDSWRDEGEEEEEALPLSQRLKPSVQFRTPVSSKNKRPKSKVPITPMAHYSDMDTPELKNKLNRFGVRPLPKRQMILKLKEIHQYTHQLVSSDSEDEAACVGQTVQVKTTSALAASRPVTCGQKVKFKEPRAPAAVSPVKHRGAEEEGELLSASQGSNTSSTAASEESERSNPELCPSSDGDSDSDGGVSASQAASKLQSRLQAVRSFILADSELYNQILQYQPLVLSQLQGRLKEAGIRLGAAKLVDYLDSLCITFTTAKPGHAAPGRGRRKKAKVGVEKGRGRKKAVSSAL
ncbi:structure-specific endonuclease subunit SLX4 isoform X3 [Cynoglossus semilaevis]|uniref:structure-specific endonuclease subunit SLX4 isoform X3 n=1 Tax=Cynoglossus semilaevis TaxID=244447 RepID=UPI0007DCAE15|nr:structure-specific endonuclease subunit SLX4 isoform X3 [Cynoglossus semilaevis]